MRRGANSRRTSWVSAALVVAVLAVSLGMPGASLGVTDPNPVRVHATTATGFGDGTRIYDISARPGPTGSVTITEPAGNQAYPGTVTCFSMSGADAVVGAMVIQQGTGTGLEYGVVLRIHDAGPGGVGDTIAEETPWTTDVEPDCGIPAVATPMPVVSGFAAVGDTSDGSSGSVTGSGTIDIGGGDTQSFDVVAERTPGGAVSGSVSMSTSAGTSYEGTVDCLSIFGTRAVIGVTLSQVPAPPYPWPHYQTIFVEDGATDTLAFNALSDVDLPDCAAGPESAPSPLVAGEFAVSTGPLPTPAPSPTPTPSPTPQPSAGPPTPPAIDFVTANGRELQVGGRPWRFTGINMYNAASDGWCNFAYDDATFASALDEIGLGADQHGVVRAWFFQPQAIHKGTDSRDWTRLDRVLRIAAEKGYRVIPTLTDQWGECGSDAPNGYKGLAWYSGGYTSVDPGMVTSYRDWVAEVVARYRDDPTILAWQLINEGELRLLEGCPADDSMTTILKAWARDVSDLVRSIDPNHLISLGTIGGGQCGAVMTQWQDLHDLPNIDLCEVHDYAGAASPPIYGDQWNGLQRRIEQCAALDKPLFVGEVGMQDGIGLQARADAFERRLAYQANAGIVGHVAWAWQSTEAYSITTGDPALDVLARGPFRVVTSIADIDDGSCDTVTGCEFREAMNAANAGIDNGSIRFDLPVGSGPIRPTVGFPGLNGDVIVDGRPLPGDTTPVPVVIDGSLAGSAHGLSIDARVTIQGLEIRDFGGSGILVQGADNLIGGTEAGADNRIVGNAVDGVAVEDRNEAVRNAVLGNEITGNGRLSINLGEHAAPSLNSIGFPVGEISPGTGPNERIYAPLMSPATPGATTATGAYRGVVGREFRFEVFLSDTCQVGRPWAQTLIGTQTTTMPAGPMAQIEIAVPVPDGLEIGYLSATATDQFGNTSEVGPCAPVAGPADMRLESLTADPASVSVSRTLTVTAVARNDGPSTALGAVVAVGWPMGAFEIVSGPALAGCETIDDVETMYVACWPAPIPAGEIVTLSLELRALTVGDATVEAIATILPGGDLDGSNDTAATTVHVIAAAATDQGLDVQVVPADPATGTTPVEMTFATVTDAGVTTLEVSSSGPAIPSGFQLGDPPLYYDLETTATFTGDVEICITYDDTAFADESAMRLYHYDATIPGWEDVTSSHDLDANSICGLTDSLSPFAIVERLFAFDGFFSPVDDFPTPNKVKAGAAVPVKFSLGGYQGDDIFAYGSPSVRLITCPNAPSDPLESTAPAGANGLSYDPTLDRYTWVWKTSKSWAGSCRELTINFSDGSSQQAIFWFTR